MVTRGGLKSWPKRKQASKEWLDQFGQSAQQQQEVIQKRAESALLSTFQWSPEIAKQYKKKKQTEKEWKLLSNEQQKQFERNEASFGYLPEKTASLASYLVKQQEQGKTLSKAHQQFLEGLKQGNNVRIVNF